MIHIDQFKDCLQHKLVRVNLNTMNQKLLNAAVSASLHVWLHPLGSATFFGRTKEYLRHNSFGKY